MRKIKIEYWLFLGGLVFYFLSPIIARGTVDALGLLGQSEENYIVDPINNPTTQLVELFVFAAFLLIASSGLIAIVKIFRKA